MVGLTSGAFQESGMPFCTIVEFQWDESFDHAAFARAVGGAGDSLPAGCLSRISSVDSAGARIIEVWQSGQDAQAFAEQSKPFLDGAQLPAPSRVSGFELTSYLTA
jgi:hypothetical protein